MKDQLGILFAVCCFVAAIGIVMVFVAYGDTPQIESELAGAMTETEVVDETETELPYSADDFYELSHVIQAEAGYCEWDMMVGVGSVVLNRVKHEAFPDSVYEVIHQPGQYSCVSNGSFAVEPTEEVKEVTDYLLRNGSEYPIDVVYQANFAQGSAIYKTLSTSYSTMYFCYR